MLQHPQQASPAFHPVPLPTGDHIPAQLGTMAQLSRWRLAYCEPERQLPSTFRASVCDRLCAALIFGHLAASGLSAARGLAQQALFAFVDSLVKTLLTCIAEPPSDARDQAVAQGKFRYNRFLKSVGAAMAGDSKAAMVELLNHSDKG